jgi:hypothetical protein
MTATLSTTITPEATTVAKRLVHPSPCTTPERPKATNTTKTTTPQNPTETNKESDDAKPPAKPTTQKKLPPTTTTPTDTQKTKKTNKKQSPYHTIRLPNQPNLPPRNLPSLRHSKRPPRRIAPSDTMA